MAAAPGPAAGVHASADQGAAVTGRALAVGLVCVAATVVFIHWAELVLGGERGHSALANTSIPVGAFFALAVVLACNAAVGLIAPRHALTQRELILVYILCASATVITSSGGVHFLVPTLTAPWYFATPENRWAEFQPYIPRWFSPHDPAVIKPFYEGQAAVPWGAWAPGLAAWIGFSLTFGIVTLCLCAIVRRQWVRHEKLTFPTVYVPLYTTSGRRFWLNHLVWIGFAIPFLIGTLNTLNLNFPVVPKLEVRNIDLSPALTGRPWTYLRPLSLSLYPFVTGIAYLLSLEVTFSSVFFFGFTKLQQVVAGTTGWSQWGSGQMYSKFPFLEHQGAGSFLAFAFLSLWAGRAHYGALLRRALTRPRKVRDTAATEDSPLPVWGLVVCLVLLLLFCLSAGTTLVPLAALLVLSLIYMTAATRIRAETGNAWLFGPQVDPNLVMMAVAGSRAYGIADLTIMAHLSNISSYDLRCLAMPHQLDGFKLADECNLPTGRLVAAMVGALALALGVAFTSGLWIWYRFGALAKLDNWRTLSGRRPFEQLQSYVQNRTGPDWHGDAFMLVGAALTTLLMTLRTKFLWWPLHPVGYALANTYTMDKVWVPFTIAWILKAGVLRYGGPKLYQKLLPLFVGLIAGDLFNGGFWTLVGCLYSRWHVYPMNW